MKTAVVIAAQAQAHQRIHGEAFAEGLKRHGWNVSIGPYPAPCDLLVLWGVRNRVAIEGQVRRGGAVCILERGYVGDRFQWTSVSFGGGLNGRGQFYGPFDDASRWDSHFAHLMRRWKTQPEGPVVVMGQVPTDNSVRGIDINAWCRNTCTQLLRQGYRAYVRTHPQHQKPAQSLEQALAGASMAVTWNSNSGVDAVLAGVPTIAMDEGSMAWPVTGHELHTAPTPDRIAWAQALAWKQWRIEELQSGLCWELARPVSRFAR